MDGKASLVLSFAGPEPDSELLEWIAGGWVGGVVLFAGNFVSTAQLAGAIARLKSAGTQAVRFMIDEEGGRVRRLPPAISPMPSIASYGRENGAARAATDYAALCGRLAALGIDTLLAPVVDVGSEYNFWLADRTFSDQPHAVSDFARQAVPAIQRTGLAACAKHFPGLAGVRDDLHHQRFVVRDSAREIESRDLPPFQSAIKAGVEMVMVSHAVYTAFDAVRPAVFSPVIIGEILRKRLGFTGLVLSDDLAMRAVADMAPIEKVVEQAVRSGCNLLLLCHDRALQRRAVQYIMRQGGEI